jgi:hypothetical protein
MKSTVFHLLYLAGALAESARFITHSTTAT